MAKVTIELNLDEVNAAILEGAAEKLGLDGEIEGGEVRFTFNPKNKECTGAKVTLEKE